MPSEFLVPHLLSEEYAVNDPLVAFRSNMILIHIKVAVGDQSLSCPPTLNLGEFLFNKSFKFLVPSPK